MSNEEVTLTDEEILAIAGTVDSAPVTPWQLKDNVVIGDIRRQVLSFARAVIEAHDVKSNPSFAQEVIEFEFTPPLPGSESDDNSVYRVTVDPDIVFKLKG